MKKFLLIYFGIGLAFAALALVMSYGWGGKFDAKAAARGFFLWPMGAWQMLASRLGLTKRE